MVNKKEGIICTSLYFRMINNNIYIQRRTHNLKNLGSKCYQNYAKLFC